MKKKILLLCYVFLCEIKSFKYLPMVCMWNGENQNTPNKWFKLKFFHLKKLFMISTYCLK